MTPQVKLAALAVAVVLGVMYFKKSKDLPPVYSEVSSF